MHVGHQVHNAAAVAEFVIVPEIKKVLGKTFQRQIQKNWKTRVKMKCFGVRLHPAMNLILRKKE